MITVSLPAASTGRRAHIDGAVHPIALHDLLVAPYVMPGLFWRCEGAEHVVEQKIDNYRDTLANGTAIAMT
jgi:hypothetical protein